MTPIPRLFLIAVAAVRWSLPLRASLRPTTPDYDNGLALGIQAYKYGIPLLDMQRIHETSTSVNVPDGLGHGRTNEFSHVRKLARASEHTVVAPNNDTLYSMAWLDLSKEPQVLHAPAIHNRFWEFELVDPWTNNFYNVTSAHRPLGRGDFRVTSGGDWAVVGPDFHGKLPAGVTKARSPYDRVWVIGRTYIRGKPDLGRVHAIQDRYSITPLSKFGTDWQRRPPRHIHRKPTEATIPGTQPGDDPLDFYRALGHAMQKFPPPAADDGMVGQLATVGIGPGLDPATAGLSADTLDGLRDAVGQGPTKVQDDLRTLYLSGFGDHNGYLIGDLGDWGTDYQLRAIGDRVGVGGQRANIAVYPFALTDNTLAPLSGSKRYVLHIPAEDLPIRPGPSGRSPSTTGTPSSSATRCTATCSTTGRTCTPTPTARSTCISSTTSPPARPTGATGCRRRPQADRSG